VTFGHCVQKGLSCVCILFPALVGADMLACWAGCGVSFTADYQIFHTLKSHKNLLYLFEKGLVTYPSQMKETGRKGIPLRWDPSLEEGSLARPASFERFSSSGSDHLSLLFGALR